MRKYYLLALTFILMIGHTQDNGPDNDGDVNSSNEIITSITLDASDVLTINEGTNSESVSLSALASPPDSITAIQTVGNEIATFTNGTTTSITETVKSLVDNNNGTHSFTNEAGAVTTFSTASGSGTANFRLSPLIKSAFSDDLCLNDIVVGSTGNYDISGYHFDGTTTVSVPGQTVNSVTINSSTSVTANITFNTLTDSDIVLSNSLATKTLANAIRVAPTVNSFSVSDMVLSSVNAGEITYDGTTLGKVSGSTAWDSAAYSTAYKIKLGQYGRLNFNSGSANVNFFMGLDPDPAFRDNYATIDYGIYALSDTSIRIYENNVSKITVSSIDLASDLFSINVDCDGVVTYLVNNGVVYTSANPVTTDLYFDSSFRIVGTSATNITLEN